MGGESGAPAIPYCRSLSLLGERAAGTLYAADSDRYGGAVTVTVYPRPADDRARIRFEAAVDTARRLGAHPNIVTIHASGHTDGDGRPYVVSDGHDRTTAQGLLATSGVLGVDSVLPIGIALAGALETAHRAGVVHGGVSPGVVLLRADGQPVLTEVGLSDFSRPSGASSLLARWIPYHAPPEILEGTSVSPATDVYSLASVIFTLLVGQPPHAGTGVDDSTASLLLRILQMPMPAIERSDVPPALEDTLRTALSHSPAKRPQHALELAWAMQDAQRMAGLEVSEPVVLDLGPSGSSGSAAAAGTAVPADPWAPQQPPTDGLQPRRPTPAPAEPTPGASVFPPAGPNSPTPFAADNGASSPGTLPIGGFKPENGTTGPGTLPSHFGTDNGTTGPGMFPVGGFKPDNGTSGPGTLPVGGFKPDNGTSGPGTLPVGGFKPDNGTSGPGALPLGGFKPENGTAGPGALPTRGFGADNGVTGPGALGGRGSGTAGTNGFPALGGSPGPENGTAGAGPGGQTPWWMTPPGGTAAAAPPPAAGGLTNGTPGASVFPTTGTDNGAAGARPADQTPWWMTPPGGTAAAAPPPAAGGLTDGAPGAPVFPPRGGAYRTGPQASDNRWPGDPTPWWATPPGGTAAAAPPPAAGGADLGPLNRPSIDPAVLAEALRRQGKSPTAPGLPADSPLHQPLPSDERPPIDTRKLEAFEPARPALPASLPNRPPTRRDTGVPAVPQARQSPTSPATPAPGSTDQPRRSRRAERAERRQRGAATDRPSDAPTPATTARSATPVDAGARAGAAALTGAATGDRATSALERARQARLERQRREREGQAQPQGEPHAKAEARTQSPPDAPSTTAAPRRPIGATPDMAAGRTGPPALPVIVLVVVVIILGLGGAWMVIKGEGSAGTPADERDGSGQSGQGADDGASASTTAPPNQNFSPNRASNLTAVETEGGVQLDWEGPEGAAYLVRILSPTEPPRPLGAGPATALLVPSDMVQPGGAYCFDVVAAPEEGQPPVSTPSDPSEVVFPTACIGGAQPQSVIRP